MKILKKIPKFVAIVILFYLVFIWAKLPQVQSGLFAIIFAYLFYVCNMLFTKFDLRITHLLASNNSHEKALLEKNIINYVQRGINKEDLTEKQYDELKKDILATDQDYFYAIGKLFQANKTNEEIEELAAQIREALYNRNYTEFKKCLAKINKNAVADYEQNELERKEYSAK